MAKTVVMDHPLIQHKIGHIRKIETGTRDLRNEIGRKKDPLEMTQR